MNFQPSVSPIMEGIIDLHNHIFFFLILIFVFVFWLFANIIYQFWWKVHYSIGVDNGKEGSLGEHNSDNWREELSDFRNFNHSTDLEIVWTIVPSLILVAIAIPSFALLYSMDEVIEPVITLKVIGHQWYWTYQYSNCVSPWKISPFYFPQFLPKEIWKKLWEEALQYLKMEREIRSTGGYTKDSFYGSFMRTLYRWGSTTGVGTVLTLFPTYIQDFCLTPYFIEPNKVIVDQVYEQLNKPISSFISMENHLISFDSYMTVLDEQKLGSYRLLEVDEPVILPILVHLRLLVTAEDVLHSFGVPQLGIKLDAVPGRLNQQGVYIKQVGSFYGQCSELCGVNHGFMPTVIKAVPLKEFINWYLSKLETFYGGGIDLGGLTMHEFLEGPPYSPNLLALLADLGWVEPTVDSYRWKPTFLITINEAETRRIRYNKQAQKRGEPLRWIYWVIPHPTFY